MVTIDRMGFSRVGSNNDERDLQIRRLFLRRLVVVVKNVIDRRRFTKQIKVRI